MYLKGKRQDGIVRTMYEMACGDSCVGVCSSGCTGCTNACDLVCRNSNGMSE